MRSPHGYAVITEPGAKPVEMDTVGCKHCGRHTHIKPKQDPTSIGGLCYVCMGYVCAQCVGKGCDEVQRKLERAEASYHSRRSYGLCD